MKITKLLMEELWLVFVFLHDIAGVCLTPEAILALDYVGGPMLAKPKLRDYRLN